MILNPETCLTPIPGTFRCSRKAPASISTFPAGPGTVFTVVMVMLFAFLCAQLTQFNTFLDDMLCMLRMGSHKTRRQLANLGTVPVKADTAYHHLYIVL